MARTTFLDGARTDFRKAFAWYYQRSARAAAGFDQAVDPGLTAILEAPECWPLCSPRHRLYKLKKYPHSIIYRIIPDEVLVVAIAHAKRRWGYWRRRDRGPN
jgi:plasmid stabilization system protein ParE